MRPAERGKHAGSLGPHEGQTRPDHGGRQSTAPSPGASPRRCTRAGAELAFTYQGDVFKKRVVPLVEPLKPAALIDCDVSDQDRSTPPSPNCARMWDSLDFLVHAIAFSDKEQLKGRYVDTTPDNFRMTMDITCYSFTAVAQRAEKMMPNGGSTGHAHLLRRRESDAALQCDGRGQGGAGSQRALHGRGSGQESIRVNAISAGPIKTLAAPASATSATSCKWNEYNSPLRRNVTRTKSAMPRCSCCPTWAARRHRRKSACRCRLSHRRHEGGRRARHRVVKNEVAQTDNAGKTKPCRRASRSIFARHGETEANLPAMLFSGPTTNTPLTAAGPRTGAQADRRGSLKTASWGAPAAPATCDYVASPLERARAPWRSARDARHLPPRRLCDRCRGWTRSIFGDWDQLTDDEASARDPDCVAARAKPTNGMCLRRAARITRRSRRGSGPGKRRSARDTFAVSHGGTRRILRRLFLGLSAARDVVHSTSRRAWFSASGPAATRPAARRGAHAIVEPGRHAGYHTAQGANPCRTTLSAIFSASPPLAKAMGRRSAAWWMAARRGIAADRGRHPARSRQAAARPVELRHPAPGARRGEDPLRRLRGRADAGASDHRHADRALDRECRSALQGLFRHPRQVPAGPCRLHL